MKKNLSILLIVLVFAVSAGLYVWRGQVQGLFAPAETQRNYTATSVPLVDISKDEPELPDITKFTAAAIREKIPPLAPGQVRIVPFSEHRFYSDTFVKTEFVPMMAKMQGREDPVLIEISSGVYDLDTLVSAVNDPALLEKTPQAYVFNVPLVVQPGAGFIISKPGAILHLNAETGAFLANFGKMTILDAEVTGWRPSQNAPALFEKKDTFRPYLIFWSNSVSYLGNTKFSNLGYDFSKSYGISYSTSPAFLRQDSTVPRPTGWVVDCIFDDIYYGFYSYEADDVAVIRNTYSDNIVYGIDPHDRSRRLIIAGNNSYGAKKRHGIIISREVDDSWIFDNHTHDNHGSGIMIDRNSVRNVIANNISENNGADGLVFFESPDNLTWGNTIRNNKKNGVRIRNSWNVKLRGDEIANNGMYGLVSYTADLSGQATRDSVYDPYTQKASFDIANAQMGSNAQGHFQIVNNEESRLQNLKIFSDSLDIFAGDLESVSPVLYEAATSDKKALVIKQHYMGGAEKAIRDSAEDADPATDGE